MSFFLPPPMVNANLNSTPHIKAPMLGISLLDLPVGRVLHDNEMFFKPASNVGIGGNSAWLTMVDAVAGNQERQLFGLEDFNVSLDAAEKSCRKLEKTFSKCVLHDVQEFRRTTKEGYNRDSTSINGICSCDW